MLKNKIILFFLLLTLLMPVFNAFNSVIMIISVFLLVLKYKKIKFSTLPKTLISSILFLFFSLIISSLIICDISSINYAVKFLYWMLPFFVVFYNIQLCNNDKIPLYSFALSLFISAMAVIYQYYFLDKIRPGGLYFQPNQFASMMDILLPFATMFILKNANKSKDKFFVIISFLPVFLGFYALFLSGSRGGLLGVFLGFLLCVVCYALRNLKLTHFFLTLSSVIILFVGIAFIAYDSMPELFQRRYDTERLLLIESSYNMWNDNKLFGVGLSNWEEQYNEKYKLPQAKEKLDMPHNILAFFFSTSGLIGGIGYVVFIVGIFVFLIRHLHKCKNKQIIFIILAMLWGLFAINIHGMVDVGLNNKFVMRLFSGMLGLTAAYVCLEEQKEDCENDGKNG
jgi:O-antigen ligase